MIIIFYVLLFLALSGTLILQHPIFGKNAKGERLERIKNSKNWKDGSFSNLNPTPSLSGGATYFSLISRMLFGKKPAHQAPSKTLPSIKTDLINLENYSLVWFGHSSYIFKLNEKTFLVDPVLSGNASPIPASVKAYNGADIFHVEDLPKIDYLLISHDHYDHLDYHTIKKLIPKVKHVICGLGVGAHLEYWGISPSIVTEVDWSDQMKLENNITLTSTPARHFSGRGIKRNQTLWSSYVLQTPDFKLFVGGDSGFDSHFKSIGEKYGPFDVAILENGQYNNYWQYIHTLPDELMKVKHDLKAKAVLPVHSSKFTLALHAWNEPLELAWKHAAESNDRLLTPKIGEVVHLNDSTQQFSKWWQGLE